MTALCHTEITIQKKAQIETSLLNLMMQQSYQNITVVDICREADIPRRTFYHYFGSKEDVLESLIETLMQQCFLEGTFDIPLSREHMEQRFAKIFRFWDGENRKKLDALIKNGLESRLLTWSSQRVQKEYIGSIQKINLNPKLLEIGLMVGITDFFRCCFTGAAAAIRNPRSRWQNLLSGYFLMLFIIYNKKPG